MRIDGERLRTIKTPTDGLSAPEEFVLNAARVRLKIGR